MPLGALHSALFAVLLRMICMPFGAQGICQERLAVFAVISSCFCRPNESLSHDTAQFLTTVMRQGGRVDTPDLLMLQAASCCPSSIQLSLVW